MNTSRRDFLRSSATVAAGVGLSASLMDARAASSLFSANDKIRVGLVGCKNMGWSNLSDFLLHKEVECIALCDVDDSILNNKAAEVEKIQGKKPQLFKDYRKMIELKDLDAVIIGTPDHWHCLQLVDSVAAGKDVYVEKPLANTIAECNLMVAAARKYNRVISVGQQQRSGYHWNEMIKYIRSGELGKISRVRVWANFRYGAGQLPVADAEVPAGVDYDMWLGPAPKRPFNQQRFHGSWRMFYDYGGGLMSDWGVHLLDMGLWGMDVKSAPKKVYGFGGKFAFPDNAPDVADTQNVVYEFDDFIMTWEHSGGIQTGPYGRNYGVAFIGANGTLVADRDNWEVISEWDDSKKCYKIKNSPKVYTDFQDHKTHVFDFVDCMKTRKDPACNIENGSLCALYSHMGNIAYRTNTLLTYDAQKQNFGDNAAANALLQPEYRKPWKFPKL